MKAAHVHRFHGFLALSLPGDGDTVYLHTADARKIADALNACAVDIESRPFAESAFIDRAVELKNEGSRFK